MSHKIKNLVTIALFITIICLYYSCSKEDDLPVQAGSWDVVHTREKTLTDSLISLDTFYYKLFFDKDGTGFIRQNNGQEEKILDWGVNSQKQYIEFTVEATTGPVVSNRYSYTIQISESDYQEWDQWTRVRPGGSTLVFDVVDALYLTRIK